MAGTVFATIIVFWSTGLVISVDELGYRECIYNSYRAVCLGNYVLMSRENRGLTSFPTVTRETCLKLRRNAIARFPDDLNSLRDVTTLDLASNRINYLPNDLDKMSKLEILDVSENLLETLSQITKFPASLRGLLLAKNRMKVIPAGVIVPGLYVLDLSDNHFTDFPEEFCLSDQLIRVDFTKNPLNSDISRYIGTLNRCRNVNEIPFCLFTDNVGITCDCSSVGPLLGSSPNFCMGARVNGEQFKCTTDSEEIYRGQKLFDVNATYVQAACPLTASSATRQRWNIEISLLLASVLLFCL